MKKHGFFMRAVCLLVSILMVMSAMNICAFATTDEIIAQGTCGEDAQWTLDASGMLTVSGTGAIADCTWNGAAWYNDRQSITGILVEDGITAIGKNAFYSCQNLTEVTLPGSVTTIGASAFNGCSGLTSIVIPNGVTDIGACAFGFCYALTHITLPDTLKTLAQQAFIRCESLASVTIPAGVNVIEPSTFESCDAMTSVTFLGDVTQIGETAFRRCGSLTQITIPDTVTTIDDLAFEDCVSLPSITLPDSLEQYGTGIFHGCTGLTGVTLPKTMTAVPKEMFLDCTGLTDVTIPESVTSISYYAFSGCTNLVRVDLPEGLQWIERAAFSRCEKLTDIDIPNHLYSISDSAFLGCESLTNVTIPEYLEVISYSTFEGCSSMTEITIPKSVFKIGHSAFAGCDSLTSITIPETVIEIENGVFHGCSNLSEVKLPDNLTWLNSSFFSFCSSLTELTIPQGVTGIGTETFLFCTNLKSINIPEKVTSIGSLAFGQCESLTEITIPENVANIASSAFSGCTGMTKIVFQGPAPTISSNSFNDVNATAFHSCKDETWTQDVKQNYGGSITWKEHLFGEYVYDNNAFCAQDGTMSSVCPDCGATDTITAPGTALDHQYENGLCTLCGEPDPDYEAPLVHPTLTLKYPTLTFEDVILLNVYFDATDLQDVRQMGLITYKSKVSDYNVETADAVIPGYVYSEADGLYCATTNGIAAKDMGDEIFFAVYAQLTDGSYVYSRLVPYSPETYAYAQLATGDSQMQSMVVAMLNYGAAAQDYFGYNTDAPVNGALTEEQLALTETYREDMVATVESPSTEKQGSFTSNGGAEKRYPTVSFEGAFCINYYFTPSAQPAGDITMYYWDQQAYDGTDVLTAENATAAIIMEGAGTGEYHAAVEGIAAKDLDKGVYVCFVYSDGTTEYASGVLSYSIGTYCAAQAETDTPTATLAKATAVYGYYANQLFNN